MKQERGVRVSCPACEIDYRLRDAELLPIARCGRCYGAVIVERTVADPVFLAAAPKTKAA
jgi:Zn-finger nucleic acid-binding protein